MSKAKPATLAARALVDLPTVGARCGEVFEADPDVVDALCATGVADASPEATAAGPAATGTAPGATADPDDPDDPDDADDTPPKGPVPAPPPQKTPAPAPAAKG